MHTVPYIVIHKGSGNDTSSSIPLVVWLSLHDFFCSFKATSFLFVMEVNPNCFTDHGYIKPSINICKRWYWWRKVSLSNLSWIKVYSFNITACSLNLCWYTKPIVRRRVFIYISVAEKLTESPIVCHSQKYGDQHTPLVAANITCIRGLII